MSQKKIDPIILWTGLAVAAATAAYAGYRAIKNVNDLVLDDIFNDMNEVFFSTLNNMEDK